MNFNQMFNSLFHNQQQRVIRQQVDQIKNLWANDPYMRTTFKARNPPLAEALEKSDFRAVEALVGEQVKKQQEAQKKEQERKARLMNADPNDMEAQKEIEEDIRKDLIEKNHMLA
mmetsp:Transcript_18962/g.29089  ORF Transcript_18962/g.29089 Transcript_18962/m.29089 type:complete len:115 (-) Transcript_18962:597-941(-)